MLPPKTANFARQHLLERIQSLLDRWTFERQEPDAWRSYFLVQAIDHLAKGAFVQGEGDAVRAENPKTWSKPKLKPPDPLTTAQLRARLASAIEGEWRGP